MTDIRNYRIDVPQADLDDLRDRLEHTRWPEELPDSADWARGVPLHYLRELADHWASKYDWRVAEARLNSYPQFVTSIDGVDVHFMHVRSSRSDAFPLMLLHGWPGSIAEFVEVIAPLAEAGFDLVIPSLPGFGFSGKPTDPGWNSRRVASTLAALMSRLGYQRYGVQGGDLGALIAPDLARVATEHVVGVHVNAATAGFIPFGELPEDEMTVLADAERARLDRMTAFLRGGNAYFQVHATRPQTVSYALTDSPVGQLAWIVEKFKEWTLGDGLPEESIDRDLMLTNVMFYWLTRSAGSAADMYYENVHSQNWPTPSGVPTGVAVFAEDLPIRRYAERTNNIVHWSEFDRGGHFAAMEAPDLYVGDVTQFFQRFR